MMTRTADNALVELLLTNKVIRKHRALATFHMLRCYTVPTLDTQSIYTLHFAKRNYGSIPRVFR
jgi:hypothetical protein